MTGLVTPAHSLPATRLASAALLAVALLPAATRAAAPRSAKVHRVAVFPVVTKGKVPAAIAAATQAVLHSSPSAYDGLQVLQGAELRTRLKTPPSAAVARCERRRNTASCLARLCRRLRVDELVLARLSADGSLGKLLVLAVKRNKTIEPRARMSLGSVDEVTRSLDTAALAKIFGVPLPEPDRAKPAPTRVASAPESDADGAKPAGTQAAAALPATSPPSPNAEATVPAKPSAGEPGPRPPDKDTLTNAIVATPIPIPGATASSSPQSRPTAPFLQTPTVEQSARPETTMLRTLARYGGLGLAAVGAVALGFGGYQGAQSRSIRTGIDREAGLLQVDAVARFERSNDLANRANLLFITGGILTALGSSLFSLDLLLEE